MSNYYDRFYGYTGLFPILEASRECCHKTTLRGLLANLANGDGSLFSRTGLVHGARFFILDDVVFNAHPTTEEHLQYAYLVCSMTFDGELAPLAASIAETGGEEWDSIFRHCHGFHQENKTADSILAFLRQGQVTTSFLYVDADGDLQTTLRALAMQREIGMLVEKAQFMDTAGRKQLVLELARKMADMPILTGGGFQPELKE